MTRKQHLELSRSAPITYRKWMINKLKGITYTMDDIPDRFMKQMKFYRNK